MRELRGMGLVALRELTEALRRKSFWAIVLIMFLGSTAAMVLPLLIGDGGPTTYSVVVDSNSPTFEQALRGGLAAFDAEAKVIEVDDAQAVTTAVTEKKADAGVVFSDPPKVVVGAGNDPMLVAVTQQALAVAGLEAQLREAGLDESEVRAALAPAPARLENLDAGRVNRIGASYAISVILYILLMVLVMQVANGTAIEKSNRISEVLLAIVRPGALLFGKVLGVTATGVAVIAAAVLPVVVKLALGGDLPTGLGAAVSGGAVWFILGLVLYLTVAGALGAMVERQEEVGTVVSPLLALLVGTFLVLQIAPDSTLVAVLAYFPLCAPLIQPFRLAAGTSSTLEVVVSLVIALVAAIVLARFAAVVYKRAIVRTGRRLHLRDLIGGRHQN